MVEIFFVSCAPDGASSAKSSSLRTAPCKAVDVCCIRLETGTTLMRLLKLVTMGDCYTCVLFVLPAFIAEIDHVAISSL